MAHIFSHEVQKTVKKPQQWHEKEHAASMQNPTQLAAILIAGTSGPRGSDDFLGRQDGALRGGAKRGLLSSGCFEWLHKLWEKGTGVEGRKFREPKQIPYTQRTYQYPHVAQLQYPLASRYNTRQIHQNGPSAQSP